MRKFVFMAAAAALLLGAPGVMAQEELVGKDAAEFTAGDMLFDGDVLAKTFEETKGEVILIKYWGLKCPPCLASMPKVQKLWDEYRTKGLHIFHVESQNHTPEQITAYCEKKGYTFPQTLRSGSTDFTGYPGGRGLPYAFLVGVDGKVIWQGRSGYEQVIAEEIKKVHYAGLGKAEVAPDLKKAAKLFAAQKFGSAIKEAQKRLDGAEGEVHADAEYIIERANTIGERLKSKAEAAAEDRDYVRAMATLKTIAKAFKGFPIADEVSETLETFKKDGEIKKELKAGQILEGLKAEVKKAPTKDKQTAMLRAFAKKFDGTEAAKKALRLADSL